uniref:NADH-ubiquinone oxidoreductase chain 3 n=1 Tax=Metallyticus sp. JZ-2017 TaxID=2033292 RepID=A0A343UMR4_9NEOP|nr:NADH dehydrogenase subunit 3 [Metallyticus sp. JZ-2017]
MYILIMITSFILFIASAILIIANLLSKKTTDDREKNSPFECGFDPLSSSRLPFSLQFFHGFAGYLFIFDVEIALLLPMTIIPFNSNTITWIITSVLFLMILTIGLYHEWNQGSLDWAH